MPTTGQLRNGARGIAYRAEQLADVTIVRLLQPPVEIRGPRMARITIHNALIESSLVNARALAWFFTASSDVHGTMYPSTWNEPDLVDVAGAVIEPTSRHLGHATKGVAQGEKHPGAWPTAELAVTLVGALARFVAAIDASRSDPRWFTPPPAATYKLLMAVDPLASPTALSDNPSVAALTRRLHEHLGISPAPPAA